MSVPKNFVADEIVICIQMRTSADRGRPKPYPAAPGLDASESGGSVSVSIDELGVEGEPLTGHVLLSVRAGLCNGGTKWSGTWSRACTLSQHGVQFCCSCFGRRPKPITQCSSVGWTHMCPVLR